MALVLSTSIDDDGNPVPSTDCYPDYAEDVHSEEPFGPNNEWTFSKTKAPKMHGWVADYGTDAFVTELSRNPVVAVEQIRYMDENGYIDQQTSAIITTINTFNPNINYFCSSVFVCFPPLQPRFFGCRLHTFLVFTDNGVPDWWRCHSRHLHPAFQV